MLAFTSMLSLSLHAQDRTISGNVVDEKGTNLPGATVKLKSGGSGTTTDAYGKFSITVPPSETALVVMYIGYLNKEVPITSKSNSLHIYLSPDARSLNEVVVVGYGTQRKRDVTGAIVTVSGNTLQETPATNFVDQLKGRAAGVDVVSNGAGLGSPNQIRIRGSRSLSTSQTQHDALDQPFIVVDGIPFGGSLNDLDQDNIQSVDILKDASATAIYGSRGSGGVILVSTKRGKQGKAVVSYNAYYGNSNIMGELKEFNGPEYAQFKAYSGSLNTLNPGTVAYPLTPAELAGVQNGTSTDWQKLIYQTGHNSDQNISLSGGDENTQYGMGAGYLMQTGTIPNQNFSRYSLRTTLDHKISNHLKLGINSLTTLSYNNNPGGAGVTSGLLRLTPLAAPYNADGSLNLSSQAVSHRCYNCQSLNIRDKCCCRCFHCKHQEVENV